MLFKDLLVGTEFKFKKNIFAGGSILRKVRITLGNGQPYLEGYQATDQNADAFTHLIAYGELDIREVLVKTTKVIEVWE